MVLVWLLSLMLGLSQALPLYAAAGRAAALLPLDPRSLGMGGAALAVVGGPLAVRLNPASVASLESIQLAFSHLSWLGGTSQDQLALSYPQAGDGVWSTGLGYFSVPEFDSTGGVDSVFSAGLARADISYAKQWQGTLGSVGLGGSASYLNQRLGKLTLNDGAASVGLAWTSPWPVVRLGVTANQLPLYSTSGNPLPLELGLGLGVGNSTLLAAVDWIAAADGRSVMRMGSEWIPQHNIAVRLGVSNEDAPGAAWALSTGMGLQWAQWTANFAWQGRGALGSALIISLGIQWDSVPPTGPKINSPTRSEPAGGDEPAAATTEKAGEVGALKTSTWDSGDFDLEAAIDGQVVKLSWPDQGADNPKMAGYEVLMGMVAEAPLQKTDSGIITGPSWSDEMAVRGMTYYFRVRTLNQGGEVLHSSKVKAVQMP